MVDLAFRRAEWRGDERLGVPLKNEAATEARLLPGLVGGDRVAARPDRDADAVLLSCDGGDLVQAQALAEVLGEGT
jgi:hypothetical protein